MMNQRPFLLAGVPCSSTTSTHVTSPWDDRLVALVARAGASDAERAAAMCVAAAPVLRSTSPWRRARHLRQCAARLRQVRASFAATLTEEVGTPCRYADGEVAAAANVLEACAEEADRLAPASVGKGRSRLVQRASARGPVLAMTGVSTPLLDAAGRLGAALATGCPVVLIPPLQAPSAALALGALLAAVDDDVDLPLAQSLHVLPAASDLVDALVTDRRFASLLVSRRGRIAARATAGRRQVLVDPGEQLDAILAPDADVESACARLAERLYAHAGQGSSMIQRVLVHRDVLPAARRALAAAAERVIAGDPRDPAVTCGPLADNRRAARHAAWLDAARAAGAQTLVDGLRHGRSWTPTLLEAPRHLDVSGATGPTVVLQATRSFEEALAIVATDTGVTHAAGVFTRSPARVFHAFDRLEGGTLLHDDHPGPCTVDDVRTRTPGAPVRLLVEALLDVRTLVLGGGVTLEADSVPA